MHRRLFARGLGLGLALAAAAPAVRAAELPKHFRLEPVLASGLTEPSSMDKTADGWILITERTTGNLRVVAQGELQAAPLCSVAVISTGEAGLLGVAAHPQFVSNRWLYLYYTDAGSGKNKVTRFTVTASTCGNGLDIVANLGAGPSFLRNGGGLAFGSDGKLYIGAGDVETSGNGQNDGTLFGKILRVNDDGSVPGDNPTPGSLVYAKGIRDARGLATNAAGNVYAIDVGAGLRSERPAASAPAKLRWDLSTGSSGGVYDDPLASYSPSSASAASTSWARRRRSRTSTPTGSTAMTASTAQTGPGVKRVNDNAPMDSATAEREPTWPARATPTARRASTASTSRRPFAS
jgi:hypothetical protein